MNKDSASAPRGQHASGDNEFPRLWTPYVFRRLEVGHTLNGEIERVEEKFRPLAKKLNATPPKQRHKVFTQACFAFADDEVNALTMAMAAVDPDGPAPPEDVLEPWPELRLDEPPPAVTFPLNVLPPAVVNLVQAAAESIGCQPDLVAVPMIGVASTAIGRSASLKLKDGYFASAVVDVCIVGPPSDGKSPALDAAAAPIKRIGQVLMDEHRDAMKRWEADCQAAKGTKQPLPAQPIARRIDVDDLTMEFIPLVLQDNPRGIGLIKDELSGLLTGQNQYKGGKGNDRQVLLNLWSGTPIVKDRVGQGKSVSIRCQHPFMTIVGGTQPDMLDVFVDVKGRSDGLIERFLFACPDPIAIPHWSNAGIPKDVADEWAKVVDRLWTRPMNTTPEGRPVPHVAFMTSAAESAWKRLTNAHVDEMNAPGFPESRRGLWGKFREYAGRFALILSMLRHASDPAANPLAVPDVDEQAIVDAWSLVAYFKSHALRVRALMNHGPATTDETMAKAIIEWVRSEGRSAFSESELKQARRWIGKDDEHRAKALARLVVLNAVRPKGRVQAGPKGGRPRTVEYEVNPALHASLTS